MSFHSGTVKELYAHDVVYKFDKRKRITFGVVSESYNEGSDSEDGTGLQKDQVVVSWNYSIRKQVCKLSKLHLMSRSIIPGDIVRRLEDGKETQRGYCKKIKQFATVQIVESDKVIEHLPASRLYFIKPFDIGDAVSCGDKYGRIQGIDQMIRMQSKCGSIVEVRTSINFNIRDYWSHSVNSTYMEPGYIGQTVICTPFFLKDPKWIKKSIAMKRKMEVRQTFTILSIDICLIEVWWYSPNGHTEYAELKEDEIKKLKVLPYSEHLVVCDRHMVKLKPMDITLNKKDWIKKKSLQYLPNKVPKIENLANLNLSGESQDSEGDWATEDDEKCDMKGEFATRRLTKYRRRKKPLSSKCAKFSPGSVVAVEVLCKTSKATIVWQDGTEEEDVPTTELYYSVSLDEHEFFPGEWVTNIGSDPNKYGVVQTVNFKERTAQVNCFSFSETDEKPQKLDSLEVSVYDIKKHLKYVFRPGSVVKSKTSPENRLGKVVDSCPEGYVIVYWLNEKTENCWPHNLVLIPDSEEFEFPDDFETDNDVSDAYSWETESVISFDGDVIDEVNLQNMASQVDFIRSRISYLKEVFKQHSINKNFDFVKDLLCIYENSSYLDKYLGTTIFSLESKHFQTILQETIKVAKATGFDLRGRLFSNDIFESSSKIRNAEKENVEKMMKLESKVNAHIESNKESTKDSCPSTPDSVESEEKPRENLCMELLVMLKIRMDLAYAEIISRIGCRQALTVLTNSSDNAVKLSPSTEALHTTALNSAVLTPDDSSDSPVKLNVSSAGDAFKTLEEAPNTHNFFLNKFETRDLQKFLSTLQKEYKLLKESLPQGVWVKTFEDRTDLLSVMIQGPDKTPYEDGVFLFDIQLSNDYPKSPPSVHYISFSKEALNPNLYVEGKVCVSLLGTWMGRGSEVWGPNSTLLQLIVSIQGLILVPQPYFNEAGYEKQTHTQQGLENSRTYNEFVLLKLVQSMVELVHTAPKIFKDEIIDHFRKNGEKMCDRLIKYCDDEKPLAPDYPLLPVSKGLKVSLRVAIAIFKDILKTIKQSNEVAL